MWRLCEQYQTTGVYAFVAVPGTKETTIVDWDGQAITRVQVRGPIEVDGTEAIRV